MAEGKKSYSRRLIFLWLGSTVLAYPLLRFVGFKVPRKPVRVDVHNAAPANGVIVHSSFFLFDKKEKQWALSRKCTHLGCRLNYIEERDILECPCHQSEFNAKTGAVIKGPAKKALTFYPVDKRKKDPFYVVTI